MQIKMNFEEEFYPQGCYHAEALRSLFHHHKRLRDLTAAAGVLLLLFG